METTERKTMSVTEAAQCLGIGVNTCRELIRVGTIPSLRAGKRILVPIRGLDRMLDGASGDGHVETEAPK